MGSQNERFHTTANPYSLPNDAPEHERLEQQAKAYEMIMGGTVFHAPVQNPKKILDVGCGTGKSTVQLATKFPDAHVIGLDLSAVPAIYSKPANVEYVQGEFHEIVKSGDPRFQAGTFDYIYGRILLLGIQDWPRYVQGAATLLSPGGWFEAQESEVWVRDADGHLLFNEVPALREYHRLGSLKGLDFAAGGHLCQYLTDGGLQDIQQKSFRCVFFPIPGRPETELIAVVARRIITALKTVWDRIGQDILSQQERGSFQEAFGEFFAEREPGDYLPFFVAFGRKGP